jgi:hypothetical protein
LEDIAMRKLALAAALAALPAICLAEDRKEMRYDLQPGGSFRLETSKGAVTVTGTTSPGVRVVLTSRDRDIDELFDITETASAGRVEIVAKKRGSWSSGWWGSNDRVRWEIEVPHQTEIDVDTSGGSITVSSLRAPVKLDTSGGSIRATDIEGTLNADTSGGSIKVASIKGSANLDTSGGSISVEDVTGDVEASTSGGSVSARKVAGNLRAESSGGSIVIEDAGGRVHADTSGGSIRASFAPGNEMGGNLETSGGGISVALDPSANLRIDASGNSVTSDIPMLVKGTISRRHLSGELGRGGELLRMSTSGGGVRISSR